MQFVRGDKGKCMRSSWGSNLRIWAAQSEVAVAQEFVLCGCVDLVMVFLSQAIMLQCLTSYLIVMFLWHMIFASLFV